MQKKALILLCLVIALLSASAVQAQTVGPKVGVIPGTSMTRDEFRSRAQAQCAAIALNALAYYIVKGSYAPDIYTLQGSPAWNLRVSNMFTGRPIQGVYFEATPQSMTSDPTSGLGGVNDTPDIVPPPPALDPNKKAEEQPRIVMMPSGPNRVDPAAIRDYDAGDIFYFTKSDVLQLIIFAPDGSYYEWVDEVPNGNFRANLTLRPGQPAENLYAAQVLYYVETLAGQHYNLIQYMAGDKTIPGAAVGALPGSKKIELAARMGVTVLNPITKQEETAAKECSPGIILEGTPLKICTAGGESLSMTEMTMAREDDLYVAPRAKTRPAPKPKPGTRAPGKPRPGAPGGGRR